MRMACIYVYQFDMKLDKSRCDACVGCLLNYLMMCLKELRAIDR
uniref:Uncharacterized protein n=1 Tax=Arundo donax TaxID=35708 RepID=A0A0A9DVY9_ARUDO